MTTPQTRLEDDAALAADLVREAGTLARRMRAEGLRLDYKTSVSDVVTAADRAAEELVTGRLRVERPGDAVLGEEHGHVADSTTGRSWVVDPVDGTYNFVNDLPWWCSAVGLRDAADLLVGAVHDPMGGATYVGGPELPSTCDGRPLAPLADRPLSEISIATYLHPPFLEGEVGAAWRRAAGGAAALRWLGSMSMDQVGVATGRIGLVFQHSVAPWDELPGAAIVRGVGGVARHVGVAGKDWYVAGPPTAVDEVCSRLLDR